MRYLACCKLLRGGGACVKFPAAEIHEAEIQGWLAWVQYVSKGPLEVQKCQPNVETYPFKPRPANVFFLLSCAQLASALSSPFSYLLLYHHTSLCTPYHLFPTYCSSTPVMAAAVPITLIFYSLFAYILLALFFGPDITVLAGEAEVLPEPLKEISPAHLYQLRVRRELKPWKSWSSRRLMIGSTAPTCTYNECRGCKFRCRAEQVPVDANDPINSAYHYRCVCHR